MLQLTDEIESIRKVGKNNHRNWPRTAGEFKINKTFSNGKK